MAVTVGTAGTAVAAPFQEGPDNIDPRDLQVLAILYIEDNQPHQAIPLLKRSVDLYPENGETYMWLGVAEMLTEQLKEAEDSFMKALARNPELTEVRNYVGFLRYKQGDLSGAATEFLLALRDPVYPPVSKARVRLNLGNVYLELGNPEAARDHLATGASSVNATTDQVFEPLHTQLAKALFELDRAPEAVAALLKVIEVNDENIEAQLLLGFGYRDMGQNGAARRHLDRVVELAPGTDLSERAQLALARLQD